MFLQSTQNEKLWTFAKYLYDALGQRVRLMELGTYENKSFTYDALLLFREVTKAKTRTYKILILLCKYHRSEMRGKAKVYLQFRSMIHQFIQANITYS